MKRRLILLASTLLLCGCWAYAQSSTGSSAGAARGTAHSNSPSAQSTVMESSAVAEHDSQRYQSPSFHESQLDTHAD